MIGVGPVGLVPTRLRTSEASALPRIDPNQLDCAIATGRHPLSEPGEQVVIDTSACLDSDGEIPFWQARSQTVEAVARHVELPRFPNSFPRRMRERSSEKTLARVDPQHETSFHESPPWVIPHPGLSPLRRSAFVKRGPVRDELGVRGEERLPGRARSSKGV